MTENRLRPIAPAFYGLGLMLLAIPLIELLMGTWPPRISAVNWRFGAFGLLSTGLLLPTLGAAILLATAAGLGHRRTLRAVASIALLGCLAELSILLLFSLDAVQMRSMIQSEVKLGFDLASLKSMLSFFFGSAVLAGFGIAGWRASRRDRDEKSHSGASKERGLLVRPRSEGTRAAPDSTSDVLDLQGHDAPEVL